MAEKGLKYFVRNPEFWWVIFQTHSWVPSRDVVPQLCIILSLFHDARDQMADAKIMVLDWRSSWVLFTFRCKNEHWKFPRWVRILWRTLSALFPVEQSQIRRLAPNFHAIGHSWAELTALTAILKFKRGIKQSP